MVPGPGGAFARAPHRVRLVTGAVKITVANEEMARVPRRDRHNPTDLEELTSWAALICLLGGLAVGIIAVGVMLAFCPPLDVRSLVLLTLQAASTGA